MKDTPLDTIGDDPVEARIVAWVLGEASAFEAAELERLCGEDPGLEAFRQRLLSLHGLLTEVVAPVSDDSWKLPAGKREALAEIHHGLNFLPPLSCAPGGSATPQ